LFFKSKAEDSQNCPAGQRLNSFPEANVNQQETDKKKNSKKYLVNRIN
jgi:hypothetical protein